MNKFSVQWYPKRIISKWHILKYIRIIKKYTLFCIHQTVITATWQFQKNPSRESWINSVHQNQKESTMCSDFFFLRKIMCSNSFLKTRRTGRSIHTSNSGLDIYPLFTNTVYILDKICKKTRPILTLAAKSEDQSKELHTNHIGMPN